MAVQTFTARLIPFLVSWLSWVFKQIVPSKLPQLNLWNSEHLHLWKPLLCTWSEIEFSINDFAICFCNLWFMVKKFSVLLNFSFLLQEEMAKECIYSHGSLFIISIHYFLLLRFIFVVIGSAWQVLRKHLYRVLPRETVDSVAYRIVTSLFKIPMCLLKRKKPQIPVNSICLSKLLDSVVSIWELFNSSSVFNTVLQQFYWYTGKETNMTTLYHLFMLYKEDHVGCHGNHISKTTECLLKISNLLKSKALFLRKKNRKVHF